MNELLHLPPRNTWTYRIPFPPEAHEPFLISKSKHMNTLVHIALETYEQASSFSTRNTRRNFLTFLQTHVNKLLHFPWEAPEKNSCVFTRNIWTNFFIYQSQEQTPFPTRNTLTNIFTLHQKHIINKFHLPLKRHEQTSAWPAKNTWTNNFSPEKMNKVLHFLQETDN